MAFRFEELEIWQLAITYTNRVYTTCKIFPKNELFSLQDQLKSSSTSIAANIAEGSGGFLWERFLSLPGYYYKISL